MLYSSKSLVATVSCALFGLALHAPAAFASLSDNPPNLAVSYSELDLSSSQDSQILYARIDKAARKVCEASVSTATSNTLKASRLKKCYTAAVDNAVADVNQPQLSALHENKATRIASIR
jgi:UrcA family protein